MTSDLRTLRELERDFVRKLARHQAGVGDYQPAITAARALVAALDAPKDHCKCLECDYIYRWPVNDEPKCPACRSESYEHMPAPSEPSPAVEERDLTFRVGRKLGRTIYEGDELIGIMDTTVLALMVVDALNGKRAHEEMAERLRQANAEVEQITKNEGEMAERVRRAVSHVGAMGACLADD